MFDKLKLYLKHAKAFRCYIERGMPIYKQRWLFSSVNNTEFNYNSKYLFEYVLDKHPEIEAYYVINDDAKRAELNARYGGHFISTLDDEGISLALSCRLWFTSAGLPVYAKGLGKYYDIINLWHGIPLKKIALEDRNLSLLSRLSFKSLFSDNYKYILTSSERLSPIMQRSFAVPKSKIKIWGQPRCDVLYHSNNREKLVEELTGRHIEFNRLVLYAPTYREGRATELFPFPDYDKKVLEQYLSGSGTLIFVKGHIHEIGDFSKFYSENIFELNSSRDIMDILNIFDVLITDYSSIYIDFLKLDRGLVFLPYDRDIYIKKRGFNFGFDEVTPGAKPNSLQSFINALKGLENEYYSIKRKEVRELLDTTDGEVSELICNELMKEMGL